MIVGSGLGEIDDESVFVRVMPNDTVVHFHRHVFVASFENGTDPFRGHFEFLLDRLLQTFQLGGARELFCEGLE